MKTVKYRKKILTNVINGVTKLMPHNILMETTNYLQNVL